MYDFDGNGFDNFKFGFDVNAFVDHMSQIEEEMVTLTSSDLKAVKESKRTWADVFNDSEED